MPSTFQTFVDSKGFKPASIIAASNRLEAWGNEGRWMASQRSAKRRNAADKKYDELNLKKPTSGRAVSTQQLTSAMSGKALPRKVRAKIVRAVNALLTAKKQEAVDFKVLFEGTEIMKRKKKEEKKKEVAKKK